MAIYQQEISEGIEAMILSDARRVPLAAGSVHMVVTSPPYYALRDYGTAKWEGGDKECDHVYKNARNDANGEFRPGRTEPEKIHYSNTCGKCGAVRIDNQLGLERIPDCLGWATKVYCGECYICHLLEWAREVWRVLRDDGTFWLNIGESMSKKNLIGIPQRAMLALQADGWIVRNDIIWHKPNPMPESCGDRCTKSHEYIFLLAKQGKYYYDAEAIREENSPTSNTGGQYIKDWKYAAIKNTDKSAMRPGIPIPRNGRNRRDVWTLTTRAYSGSHYATFPPQLPEICIRAGTSERGCCPTCGKQWVRVVEKEKPPKEVFTNTTMPQDGFVSSGAWNGGGKGFGQKLQKWLDEHPPQTLGWRADCKCEAGEPVPCTVLDVFGGSGTTVMVATKLRRIGIGLDLDPRNAALEARRLAAAQLELVA
jgi:DNA modification methylase